MVTEKNASNVHAFTNWPDGEKNFGPHEELFGPAISEAVSR
jgi:hypothetical protein